MNGECIHLRTGRIRAAHTLSERIPVAVAGIPDGQVVGFWGGGAGGCKAAPCVDIAVSIDRDGIHACRAHRRRASDPAAQPRPAFAGTIPDRNSSAAANREIAAYIHGAAVHLDGIDDRNTLHTGAIRYPTFQVAPLVGDSIPAGDIAHRQAAGRGEVAADIDRVSLNGDGADLPVDAVTQCIPLIHAHVPAGDSVGIAASRIGEVTPYIGVRAAFV